MIKENAKNGAPPILFVGAGPGDPELITVKGQKALERADLVIWAGSLVPQAVLKWTGPEAETLNSASMHLQEIVDAMAAAHEAGKRVVRLHTGDPSLYGAIFEQMAALDERNVPYSVIPGVTAAFAAAAALKMEYTLPEITQTLILTRMAGRTPVPEAESLRALAAHQASMAIYLSMGLIHEVAEILTESYGADAPCAVTYRVSQPEEKIFFTSVQELPQKAKTEGIDRLALVIVGPAVAQCLARRKPEHLSRLYDKDFRHGYRK